MSPPFKNVRSMKAANPSSKETKLVSGKSSQDHNNSSYSEPKSTMDYQFGDTQRLEYEDLLSAEKVDYTGITSTPKITKENVPGNMPSPATSVIGTPLPSWGKLNSKMGNPMSPSIETSKSPTVASWKSPSAVDGRLPSLVKSGNSPFLNLPSGVKSFDTPSPLRERRTRKVETPLLKAIYEKEAEKSLTRKSNFSIQPEIQEENPYLNYRSDDTVEEPQKIYPTVPKLPSDLVPERKIPGAISVLPSNVNAELTSRLRERKAKLDKKDDVIVPSRRDRLQKIGSAGDILHRVSGNGGIVKKSKSNLTNIQGARRFLRRANTVPIQRSGSVSRYVTRATSAVSQNAIFLAVAAMGVQCITSEQSMVALERLASGDTMSFIADGLIPLMQPVMIGTAMKVAKNGIQGLWNKVVGNRSQPAAEEIMDDQQETIIEETEEEEFGEVMEDEMANESQDDDMEE